MLIAELRRTYHQQICANIIRVSKGYPNFADGSNKRSIEIARDIVNRLGCEIPSGEISGQSAGDLFEYWTAEFIRAAFAQLQHLRPGDWLYLTEQTDISNFVQYAHLADLATLVSQYPELSSAFGGEYIVKPDIIIGHSPLSDKQINANEQILDSESYIAMYTPLREANLPPGQKILHASISCKWTIRSDRSQNARTEALNLIRHRKGHTPHIAVVTAEPLPTRISTLALGTGDLDCVYHFALPELYASVEANRYEDQLELLNYMIEGKRLRDISDLPFDLAI